MSEILSNTLNIITIFISLTAIIIIVFDRIKNSINIRKQVKTYYEAIEKLIFHYYERGYFEELNENEEFKKNFYEHHSKWILYENYVKNYFNDFAKYLGLVQTQFAYINDSSVFLSENGSIKMELNHYKEGYQIDNQLIEYINSFLDSCVKYWNRHHKSIVKKGIKRKIDFKILKGFKKPYIPEPEPVAYTL
ncbi:MAG: hypothetical protein ACFFG0_51970 [Candidatus Thorarchaeota archaeon]